MPPCPSSSHHFYPHSPYTKPEVYFVSFSIFSLILMYAVFLFLSRCAMAVILFVTFSSTTGHQAPSLLPQPPGRIKFGALLPPLLEGAELMGLDYRGRILSPCWHTHTHTHSNTLRLVSTRNATLVWQLSQLTAADSRQIHPTLDLYYIMKGWLFFLLLPLFRTQ